MFRVSPIPLCVVALALCCSGVPPIVAQDIRPAPKILVISREDGKRGGAAPSRRSGHAIVATSASGTPRTLIFEGYDSWTQWEKARSSATGSADETIWTRRDDLSLRPGFRPGSHAEVTIEYRLRPGHAEEFEELVKLYTEGYQAVPAIHWGTYEETYGAPGNVFLVIITHKDAAELDSEDANDAKFVEALGPERLKKLAELEASCLESKHADLYFLDPGR
jgi:hypothetical protein